MGNIEHIGIAGVNGSGKTTLLTALMRKVPDDLSTLFIPQEIGSELAAHIMAGLHEASPGERGRVLSIVAQLNSDPDRILDGDELSPGELRKIMLARGICVTPQMIAMDERNQPSGYRLHRGLGTRARCLSGRACAREP